MKNVGKSLNAQLKDHLIINSCVNSSATVLFEGEEGEQLHRPKIVGSATEGALLLMVDGWGVDIVKKREENYHKETDKVRG